MTVPYLNRRASLALTTPYVAPADEIESLIATIFAQVVSIDRVGVNDDFVVMPCIDYHAGTEDGGVV